MSSSSSSSSRAEIKLGEPRPVALGVSYPSAAAAAAATPPAPYDVGRIIRELKELKPFNTFPPGIIGLVCSHLFSHEQEPVTQIGWIPRSKQYTLVLSKKKRGNLPPTVSHSLHGGKKDEFDITKNQISVALENPPLTAAAILLQWRANHMQAINVIVAQLDRTKLFEDTACLCDILSTAQCTLEHLTHLVVVIDQVSCSFPCSFPCTVDEKAPISSDDRCAANLRLMRETIGKFATITSPSEVAFYSDIFDVFPPVSPSPLASVVIRLHGDATWDHFHHELIESKIDPDSRRHLIVSLGDEDQFWNRPKRVKLLPHLASFVEWRYSADRDVTPVLADFSECGKMRSLILHQMWHGTKIILPSSRDVLEFLRIGSSIMSRDTVSLKTDLNYPHIRELALPMDAVPVPLNLTRLPMLRYFATSGFSKDDVLDLVDAKGDPHPGMSLSLQDFSGELKLHDLPLSQLTINMASLCSPTVQHAVSTAERLSILEFCTDRSEFPLLVSALGGNTAGASDAAAAAVVAEAKVKKTELRISTKLQELHLSGRSSRLQFGICPSLMHLSLFDLKANLHGSNLPNLVSLKCRSATSSTVIGGAFPGLESLEFDNAYFEMNMDFKAPKLKELYMKFASTKTPMAVNKVFFPDLRSIVILCRPPPGSDGVDANSGWMKRSQNPPVLLRGDAAHDRSGPSSSSSSPVILRVDDYVMTKWGHQWRNLGPDWTTIVNHGLSLFTYLEF